jgi:uncharacterized protein (TIGR00730 family)
MLKRICIFCGSSTGFNPVYRESAMAVGQYLAEKNIGLVYGGGSVGLMGAVAEAALTAGGEVIGIIPKDLYDKEIAHLGLRQLCVVGSMHERKALMGELSDAFIALPGGFGTLEELMEVITWSQLGIHLKPCGILNVAGFFDPLLAMCDYAVEQGFIRSVDRALVITDSEPEKLIDRVCSFKVPTATKWLTPNQT